MYNLIIMRNTVCVFLVSVIFKEMSEQFLDDISRLDWRQMTSDDVTSITILRHDLQIYINGFQWVL